METVTREIKVVVQNDSKHAIDWLDSEYPHGADLVYVDYRHSFDDNIENLQELLKTGYIEREWEWEADAQYDSICEILKNYKTENEIEELSDEVEESMREWLYEHDTSTATTDLLKHTSRQLCYIETADYIELENENRDPIVKKLQKKYARNDEQKAEIATCVNESFYSAPVSFYFYVDVEDMFRVLHGKASEKNKYVIVSGAYFSSVDRVQGSNWIGEKAVFDLIIPRQDFIKNVYLDEAKGTGYGWGKIAGQTSYAEAEIDRSSTQKRGLLLIEGETSEEQQREKRLAENWEKTKKCTFGDMNYGRHTGKQGYVNEYPCGNKCEDCGTFWID